MSPHSSEIIGILAKAVTGPAYMIEAILGASLSVGETLTRFVRLEGLADDLRHYKVDSQRRSRAATRGLEAGARTKEAEAALTEAQAAENKVNLELMPLRIANRRRFDELLNLAESAEDFQRLAEIRAINRAAAKDAEEKLREALRVLKDRGGTLVVELEDLS